MLEKVSQYCRNVHNFVYEGSLSVYELLLKVILKEDEIVDYTNALESTVNSNNIALTTKINTNQTLINNKVDANQVTINSRVDANYLDLNTRKENSSDITNLRKLSPTGGFTGQIQGVDSLIVLAEISPP